MILCYLVSLEHYVEVKRAITASLYVQKKGGADVGADGDAIITPNPNVLLLPLLKCPKERWRRSGH